MSFIIALNIFATLTSSLLGYLVWSRSPQQKSARTFAFLAFSTAGWILANIFFLTSHALIFLRLAYATGLIVPLAGIRWVTVFSEIKEKSPWNIFLFSFGILFSIIAATTGLVVKSVGIQEKGGVLFNLYGLFLGVLIVTAITDQYIAYSTSTSIKKQQARTILIGYITFGFAAAAIDVISPLVHHPEIALLGLDSTAGLFLVIASAYAITQHGLFDLKLIVAELAAAGLIAANFIQLLTSSSTSEVLQRASLLVFVSFFGYLLVRSVQNEVRRREEIERLARERSQALTELEQRNKNLAVLQRISKLVLNEIEMKPMAQKILDEIPRQFEHCNGALLSLVRSGHLVSYALSANEFANKISGFVGTDLEKYSYPIQKDFNLLHRALVERKNQESNLLADFISPPIPKTIAHTLQTVMGSKHLLALPLFAGDEPLGVLLFSYKLIKENLPEKDTEMAVAIADDMTLAIQRALAYQQLKNANEYLSDLDKLKDEFISMASHELNTPLAAVEGYLSMILDEGMGKVDSKAKVYLQRAYDSSKRLADLILDLLNVSRIEQGRVKMKFDRSNLYDLAESVIHELQVKADAKQLTLKLDAKKTDVPETWCDPDRIREVFVNLIGNAIKYTDKGGVTIRLKEDLGRLRVEIADSGRGIAKADQSKLFQKFSQVNRQTDEHQGTGLGLYISKNFVELHKGRIWVESDQGKGSTFIFELPILRQAPEKVDGAILEGPLSAPKVELRQSGPPAGVVAKVKSPS